MTAAHGHTASQQDGRNVPPKLDTRIVMQGSREVILVHGTEEYRLKVTSSGKLILTK